MIDGKHLNDQRQQRLNRLISIVLRAGVAAGLAIVLAGLILIPVMQSPYPMAVMPLFALPSGLAALNPLALITAGILLVLALPVIVITLAFSYYISIRDRRMIIVCGILLAMVLFSFIYAVS